MQPKTVSSTAIENHIHKVFPQDLNTNGTVFGGLVMSVIDKLTLVVAERHSDQMCVTASIDALHFLAPAFLGEILLFKASLNRAWNTSMEVGARVTAENIRTKEHRHVVSAYFTFVALDENHKPIPIPQVIPETPIQKRRYEEANLRRSYRIQSSQELKTFREKNPYG